ncbi:unnamed protein product [Urochloa decumbens]|uniref:F-box domain-containing protein n=1 Tax=Urochloa decumbens TaxID=240449 RepID=A0ABC9BP38_9POAL
MSEDEQAFGDLRATILIPNRNLPQNQEKQFIFVGKDTSAPMEACSRAGTLSSLWALAINLSRLAINSINPSLLKKFRKVEHAHPPPLECALVDSKTMELETMVGTLPGLPQDVLEVIFGSLEIPDLIRASSVCCSWRAAYTSMRDLGRYKQSQTPCLFYTSESASDNVACLYSLVEKRTYKVTLPDPPIRSRILIGSSNGWLITADEKLELLLVNPITGEQIALPSVVTIEHVKPIFDGSGAIHKFELSYYTGEKVYWAPEIRACGDLREELYFKAFVFPDLSTGSYIAVLIHNPYYQLSFARAGDDKWTWLPPNAGYRDCMYMDGVLYALTNLGEIDAFDLSGSTVTRTVIVGEVKDYIYESMYIIPSPWGGLLQVWRTVDSPRHEVGDGPEIVYAPDHKGWRVNNHRVHEFEDGDTLGIVNNPEQVDEDGNAPRIVNAPEQDDMDGDAPEYGPATHVKYVTQKILVYKVDMAAKELVKINSLPHHLLFLGHNLSLCLHAEEHSQLNANHAYFTDDHKELIMVFKDASRDIGAFNLENCRRKEIMSKIWSDMPYPTWIVPNIMKMNLEFRKKAFFF